MSQKRERSVNFSREETNLLIKNVEEKKDIIENKKSDAVTWNEKENCWKSIENIFNATSGVTYRSAKTLKSKYESIKRETRKKAATIRAETYRTGGGPSTAPVLTPIEVKVKDMILLSVDGMESIFDSDNVLKVGQNTPTSIHHKTGSQDKLIDMDHEQFKENVQTETEVVAIPASILGEIEVTQEHKSQCPNDAEDIDETPPNKKWSHWKPTALRSRKHPALCKPKPRKPFEKLAEAKMAVAELQQQLLLEELENKRKTWAFEEEEREHKRKMWELEKQAFLNKTNK